MILNVEEEFETMNTLVQSGSSLTRFGDGELRLAVRGSCVCQCKNDYVSQRLLQILKTPLKGLMVCIPRIVGRFDLWRYNYKNARYWSRNFITPIYINLLNNEMKYYSAFITRVDNASHIDCEQFWNLWKSLWNKKDIVIAKGSGKFKINENLFGNANTIEVIDDFPERDAAADYENILKRLCQVKKDKLILLGLGPVATVLAYDLHKKGYRALDVGHLEMFYRRGHLLRKDLISKELITQYKIVHRLGINTGDGGRKWAGTVLYLANTYKIKKILDYGSGKSSLATELMKIKSRDRKLDVLEYDVCIKDKSCIPKHPFEMVVCTDVLEHVELNKLGDVMDFLSFLTGRVGFFVIATRISNKNLPDGTNQHKIVKGAEWWKAKMKEYWFSVENFPVRRGGAVALLCRNQDAFHPEDINNDEV